MDILRRVIIAITFILLFSTTICGLYIHFAKDKITDYNGSVNFHLVSAILTVIFVIVSFLLPHKK